MAASTGARLTFGGAGDNRLSGEWQRASREGMVPRRRRAGTPPGIKTKTKASSTLIPVPQRTFAFAVPRTPSSRKSMESAVQCADKDAATRVSRSPHLVAGRRLCWQPGASMLC